MRPFEKLRWAMNAVSRGCAESGTMAKRKAMVARRTGWMAEVGATKVWQKVLFIFRMRGEPVAGWIWVF